MSEQRTDARMPIVEELIDLMSDSTKHIDCHPLEVLNACVLMTHSAIKFIVQHSSSHEARILNQRVALDVLDALRFAAVDESDKRMVM